MPNLTPVSSFDNVPELETTTLALGGPGGPMNLQAAALLNRTQWLKDNAVASTAGPYAAGAGTANAITAAFTPPITALADGLKLRILAGATNTGAATFAPDALTAQPIVGGAYAALQGGEILANGEVELTWNAALGAWVITAQAGGSPQVPDAAHSKHAASRSQVDQIGVDLASTASGKGSASVGFIQSFTGAVPQTVEDELRKSASLLNSGCVGDGSDESTKIQAVFDSGLDVYVPTGTFTATGLVLSTSGARLYGPGTIKKKSGVDGVLLTISADDCIIDGVRFDGTASQPTLTSVNNIINLAGNRNKVIACYVNGSAGGGITVNAGYCYNVIAFNTVKNTDDNNIMISGADANDNLIIGNYCDTTTQQNNIFVTASPASTPTTDYNYRNRVIANTCLNSGDTGIEAGIHSVGVVIQGNTVKNAHNPEILLRDCVGAVVEGNYVEAGTNAISTHDGIAVILQTETDWRYRAVIRGNRIVGNLTRAGVYTQDGHDLQIEGNSIEETFATVNATTGVGLVGSGIALTSPADDIVIRGNTIRRMGTGVNLNQAAQTPTHNRVTVDDNAIYDVGTGINLFQTTLADSTVRDNRIGKLVTAGVNTTNSSGSNSSYLARNTITTAGYSGASPTFMSNTALAALGWFTSENAKRAAVPEAQFAFTILNAAVRRTGGTLAIEFEDGTEDAVFGVSKTTTGKIAGTSNLVDSTGSAGSTGWSLFYDGSQNLILQRRAATTGSSNRFFRYRFTQNSNEV